MKKTLALAALLAAAFAAPSVPVVAAPADPPAHCVVLPLLKAECRDAIREHVASHRAQVAATVEVTTPAWPTPPWWRCRPAPQVAGYLFDCD